MVGVEGSAAAQEENAFGIEPNSGKTTPFATPKTGNPVKDLLGAVSRRRARSEAEGVRLSPIVMRL